MNETVSGVKKVDVFNDIVSRLEDSKKARVSDDVVSGMKNYYSNKQEYRNRVELLADNLKGVKPIDSEVNNVIYLSNYMEKGIAIKTSIISFKQIWVEYRLIYNENNYKEENTQIFNPQPTFNIPVNEQPNLNFEQPKFDIPSFDISNQNIEQPKEKFETYNQPIPDYNFAMPSINDFNNDFNTSFNINSVEEPKFDLPIPSIDNLHTELDDISAKLDDNYKKLYTKVVDINKYVENFNKKKIELDRQITSLEERKNNLSRELRELENAKKEFSRYKEVEEKKINDIKTEVNNKVVSLQNLIDNLDDILGKIN